MKLSIVIPCYQEQEALPQLFTKMDDLRKNLAISHELIFIDDGSSDKTYELLCGEYQCQPGNNVRIIKHEKNKGAGGALRTGFANSEGEYIAAIDCDCTYEPSYLIDMLAILEKEGAAMITTSPYHPRGATKGIPMGRLFLSKNLSKLYNLITRSNIYTYTSMFRIYRREAIKELDFDSDGFVAMAAIMIKLINKGQKVLEFPAVLTVRKYGVSNAKILKLIKDHISLILKILFKKIS